MSARTYVVGVTAVVTVDDDGWITVAVDMSDVGRDMARDPECGPFDSDMEPITVGDVLTLAAEDSERVDAWARAHAVTGEGHDTDGAQ